MAVPTTHRARQPSQTSLLEVAIYITFYIQCLIDIEGPPARIWAHTVQAARTCFTVTNMMHYGFLYIKHPVLILCR